jgi:hypothetical protein
MLQASFDLLWHDPVTQQVVPWAEYSKAKIDEIRNAPWKVVDLETTGLTPGSAPLGLSPKDAQKGGRADLRIRVCSVMYPTAIGRQTVAFEADQLTSAQLADLSDACVTGTMFGWNVGFDAYWLYWAGARTRPSLLLDGMLIARALHPEQVLVLANMCTDESLDPELSEAAASVFREKRSGWSLADSVLANFHEIISKDAQGPRNWTKPWLAQSDYDYATGDVKQTWRLLAKMLGNEDLLAGYLATREEKPVLRLIEPQVIDIVAMRRKGMPWSPHREALFQGLMAKQVAESAAKLLDLEPSLSRFERDLEDMGAGVSAELKDAIAKAFQNRGVAVTLTDKAGTPQVGEKDLRRAKAQALKDARELFDAWVALQKAKKMSKMAREVTLFAKRSPDGRVHPLTGHGPVTGRLSSAEPNCQQFPRHQQFRDGVEAPPGMKIVASDYSALDMRVGAALAIRAQRQIQEALAGARHVEPEVLAVIEWAYAPESFAGQKLAMARKREAKCVQAFKVYKETKEVPDGPSKHYWERFRKLKREALLARFARALSECLFHARKNGDTEWGALREAFSIPGMDIHTWTALKMTGQDPVAMFSGKSDEDIAKELKAQKKLLGDKRQNGKVGNLSLLYAMTVKGLIDTAAKAYNIHWTLEEATEIHEGWFASYPEIDLWHIWTELNPHSFVYVPDPERGGRTTRKPVYESWTLGGRLIYAFGLNAALSYEDQSTGADILGTVMDTLRREYPEVFDTIVNQVHDEVVFEIADGKVDGYLPIIQKVMVDAAERFLGPFGVRAECSPAVGDTWLKD